MTMAQKRKTISAGVMLFAVALLLVELYPIIITLLNGFRRDIVILSGQEFSAKQLTLDSYMLVFKNRQMMKAMGNSILVGLLSTALSVGVGAMAAYGISRFKFRGRNALAYSFLVFRMLPQMSLVVALYLMFRGIGIRDTIFGITLAHSSFNVPYVIWMLIPFFTAVDKTFEEAAMVDGCTRFSLFRLIFLPLVAPGLVVAAVFAFINSWNEFLYALILTGVKARTAPVAISSLIGGDTLTWGQMCAASTVMLTPVFVFTLAMQKFLIRGVAAGGVKG